VARETYYGKRGVEPVPMAWYRVLPEWQQAVFLVLAIAAPAVGLIGLLMRRSLTRLPSGQCLLLRIDDRGGLDPQPAADVAGQGLRLEPDVPDPVAPVGEVPAPHLGDPGGLAECGAIGEVRRELVAVGSGWGLKRA